MDLSGWDGLGIIGRSDLLSHGRSTKGGGEIDLDGQTSNVGWLPSLSCSMSNWPCHFAGMNCRTKHSGRGNARVRTLSPGIEPGHGRIDLGLVSLSDLLTLWQGCGQVTPITSNMSDVANTLRVECDLTF